MVEFEISVNEKQGSAYIPQEIRKEFGHKLRLMPNSQAGIIYPSGASLKSVLKSIDGLRAELRRKIEREID